MRGTALAMGGRVSVHPHNPPGESTAKILKGFGDIKYGIGTLLTSGVVGFDESVKVPMEVNWARQMLQRTRGGPVAIRRGPAQNNRGGCHYTVSVKALTEMGRGNAVLVDQIIRRAAPALTPELNFEVQWAHPVLFREASTNYITEFSSLADATDWKAVALTFQTLFAIDRSSAALLADSATAALAYYDVSGFYTKMWILFLHVMWGIDNNNAIGAINVVDDVCLAASLHPPQDGAAANWQLIMSAVSSGMLIVLDTWTSAVSRLVYWLAANGLPRFQSAIAEHPAACLLDGFVVPPNPVLFINSQAAAVPVQGPVTPKDILVAISCLAARRQEQQFAIYGYIRAAIYFNRFRGNQGNASTQAFAATLEWRTTCWPRPVFANGLLLEIGRYSVPSTSWAISEARALLSLSQEELFDATVWIAVATAVSYSSALSYGHFRGEDLANYAQVHEPHHWRRLDAALNQVLTRGSGQHMPALDYMAAQIRMQIGLPSLGLIAFIKPEWNRFSSFLPATLTGENAWALGFANVIPYPVSPISILWMTKDYFDMWGLVRAPTSFRIDPEFHFNYNAGYDIFSPGHGDEILAATNTWHENPKGTPYVPLLLTTIQQTTRENFQAPRGWLAVTRGSQYSVIDNATAALVAPAIASLPDLFVVAPGSCPVYSWRVQSFIIPYWRQTETPIRLWQMATNNKTLISASAGIEPSERRIDDEHHNTDLQVKGYGAQQPAMDLL